MVRRRLLLVALTMTFLIFLMLPDTERRYVKRVREKVYYNLMEENENTSHHLKECTLG